MVLIILSFFHLSLFSVHPMRMWLNVVKEILVCVLQSMGLEAYSYPAITDIPPYFMASENSL